MLVALHWVENRKRYGLALLAMGGLLCAWFGFIISIDRFAPMDSFYQYSAYYAGLYFVGCLYASTTFSELGSRAKGIQWLSVPASHLEKLLCGLFFNIVLFFIAYTLVFYLVDIPMVKLASHIIVREHRVIPGTTKLIGEMEVFRISGGNRLGFSDDDFYTFLLGFFAAQSAFILGSVYFTRYVFIKTTIAVLLMILITTIFIMRVVKGNIPAGWRLNDLEEWVRAEGMSAPTALVRLPSWMETTGMYLVRYSAPFIFWFITYFRLKEKEV